MDIYPGEIVYSKAGRDKGRYFIVTKIIDDNFVYMADGKLRTAEKPKKKKIKHLKFMKFDTKELEIAKKLSSGEKVTNNDMKRFISEVIEKVSNS